MPGRREVAVVARYQVMEGHDDQVAELLSHHAAATLAEPGCQHFAVLRGIEDPAVFVLYERYVSQEAFDTHTASPHYEGIVRDLIRPLLQDRTVEFLQAIQPAESGPA
jgi:quinol monooxygenase YgiN